MPHCCCCCFSAYSFKEFKKVHISALLLSKYFEWPLPKFCTRLFQRKIEIPFSASININFLLVYVWFLNWVKELTALPIIRVATFIWFLLCGAFKQMFTGGFKCMKSTSCLYLPLKVFGYNQLLSFVLGLLNIHWLETSLIQRYKFYS